MINRSRTLFPLPTLLIAAALIAACSGAEEAGMNTTTANGGSSSPRQLVSEADLRAVTEANNRFAFALYHQLRAAEPERLFFSPASISTALAMTWAGARGDTEVEMARVLGFEHEQAAVHEAFDNLLEALNDPERTSYKLAIANRLWLHDGYSFLPEYLETTREHYGAEPVVLDFERQPEPSRKTINAWVEKETANKIRDLLPEGSIDELTRLVLTNAVYFKGNWEKQFNKAATAPAPFHVSEREQIEVPMMRQTTRVRYADAGPLQVAAIPYVANELSMVLLVPKEIGGLADVEKNLSAESVEKWIAAAQPQEVELHLPRFKMEAEFQLADTLMGMGMVSAFSSRANLSGMDGTRDLFLSAVVHKGFVDVNEEGTEAAAATGVVARVASAPPPPPVVRADRPFVFLIRHEATESILFLGRVKRPQG